MVHYKLEKRGFKSISGAKAYIRHLKSKGVKITRNLELQDTFSTSNQVININRLALLSVIPSKMKHTPLQMLAHEGGHFKDVPNRAIAIIKTLGRTLVKGPSHALLKRERVANINAIKAIQQYEKPELVEIAIKDYKRKMKPTYDSYRQLIIKDKDQTSIIMQVLLRKKSLRDARFDLYVREWTPNIGPISKVKKQLRTSGLRKKLWEL